MNKVELREMVQEEIRRELYSILPKLLKETVNSIMVKEVRRAKRRVAKQGVVREAVQPVKKDQPIDRMKLAAIMGYGDMKPGAKTAAPIPGEVVHSVAGIPMDGGLLSKETEMGVAHMRDYALVDPATQAAAVAAAAVGQPGPSTEVSDVEEAYEPQFADSPASLPGGVDGGAEVPAAVVAALGKRSKKVLEETEFKAHWRPGMTRTG